MGIESEKSLLTVAQVAKQLAVSQQTVYGLCQRKELAHVKIGGAIRIKEEDLAAFIEERTVKGAVPSAPLPKLKRLSLS